MTHTRFESTLVSAALLLWTSVAMAHVEFLGDLEGVAREEASLLTGLRPGGDAVLPADEPLLDPYRPGNTTTFGEPGGDVRCLTWQPGPGGTRAVLDVLGQYAELVVPLRPAHHASNLAAAAAAYVRAGLPIEGIAAGAASIELSPLRAVRRSSTRVDDNATIRRVKRSTGIEVREPLLIRRIALRLHEQTHASFVVPKHAGRHHGRTNDHPQPILSVR